ncbi:MAG: FAD:protein FMN transferase [Verrucomicrobiota bacterium]
MNPEPAAAVARNAMATRFEIVLHGANPAALRAAGEEALDEVERLEARLSLYRPSSEIARVNALAARQPVRVSPPVFELLQRAAQLHRHSGGAFDITIAPLVRCWGFMGGAGQLPDPEQIARARSRVGMHHVSLSPDDCSVRFDAEGVMLDLGAIGKGCAIDCAVRTLRESGVTSALIHGGTSTTYAIGHPPDAEAWKVALASHPDPNPNPIPSPALVPGQPPQLPTLLLRDESLSVSAGWGKSFESGGRTYGHVLDPRTGEPVSETLLAAVALPSATESDALSTALLVTGAAGARALAQWRPAIRTFLMSARPA